MPPPYQYIVLKESNQRGVVACQAAHAAAESILEEHTRDYKPQEIHVVVLVAKSSDDLERLSSALLLDQAAEIPHVIIREPDPPYNGVATAVGIAPTRDRESVRKHVEHFKVLR